MQARVLPCRAPRARDILGEGEAALEEERLFVPDGRSSPTSNLSPKVISISQKLEACMCVRTCRVFGPSFVILVWTRSAEGREFLSRSSRARESKAAA